MKIKNRFVEGKMSKDIDERLLKEGSYRHAENIRVANSEGSDAGALENVKGNKVVSNLEGLTDAKAIGAIEDGSGEKIYWFVTSSSKDLVLEYNDTTGVTEILLECSATGYNAVLNFDKDYLITGSVKVTNGDGENDLLCWTDDLNPPRMINIERAKDYAVNGFTEEAISLIKKPPMYPPTTEFTFSENPNENFMRDKFLSFAYRYKYEDGEYSALSSFTNYMFTPKGFALDFASMENDGMENLFNAVKIMFDTGNELVKDIDLVFKESGSNNVYIIETFNKVEEAWADSTEQYFVFNNSKINKVLPEDELYRGYDNVPIKAKAMDLVNDRLVFGNYVEGRDLVDDNDDDVVMDFDVSLDSKELVVTELSTSILFFNRGHDDVIGDGGDISYTDSSPVELLKGTKLTFDFNLKERESTGVGLESWEGVNLSGSYREKFEFILTKNYEDAADLANDVDETFKNFIEGLVNNNFIKKFTPSSFIQRKPYGYYETFSDLYGSKAIEDGVVYIKDATDDGTTNPLPPNPPKGNYYRVLNEGAFGVILNWSQLGRIDDEYERLEYTPRDFKVITTPSIDGEVIVEGFKVVPPEESPSEVIIDPNTIKINLPRLKYEIVYTPINKDDIEDGLDPIQTKYLGSVWTYNNVEFNVDHTNIGAPLSLKTNRSYEFGVVYLDEYNRASTVLTNSKHTGDNNNTLYVEPSLSLNQNKAAITIKNNPPKWADRYKKAIKESRGGYHNIYSNYIYKDGVYRWIRLEGESINKVKEGDELIVKADDGGALDRLVKTKVLAIETKEEDFLEGNLTIAGEEVVEEAGLYMKIRPVGFEAEAVSSRTSQDFDSGYTRKRHAEPVYTEQPFGEFMADDTFVPYEVMEGDIVSIYIKTWAYGNIGDLGGKYEKQFVSTNRYASMKEFFYAEVGNLGEFGKEETWDGTAEVIYNWDDYNDGANFPADDGYNTNIGWGFTNGHYYDNGGVGGTVSDQNFFILVNWDGTAAQDIRHRLKFTLKRASDGVIFETSPEDFNSDVFYETGEVFDIPTSPFSSGEIESYDSFYSTITMDLAEAYPSGWVFDDSFVGRTITSEKLEGGSIVEGASTIITEVINDTTVKVERVKVFYNGYSDFTIKPQRYHQSTIIDYGNCYLQGNGVESYKYKDGFNTKALITDIRPTAIDNNGYKEVRRYADLTYSEPYNPNTGVNGLNEFNLYRANYKEDIDKKFGSIQKIHSRDTDLLLFQEDKISKVMYGKSLLMNADGTSNVSLVDKVLGNQVSYKGDYGISFNPESFAVEGNAIYFSDVKRGAIMRLSLDGLNEISRLGMKQWFKDEFIDSVTNKQFGTFDPYFNQYLITTNEEKTLAFTEDVKGWTSFFTFIPDYMIGMNNKLFSFKEGQLYKHYSDEVDYNTFYGAEEPAASKVSLYMNEEPSTIKELQAISLEGSDSWNALITAYKSNVGDDIQSSIASTEFIKKEGIWYAYARRNEDTSHLDSKSTYGIGVITEVGVDYIKVNGGSVSLTSNDTILKDDLTSVGTVTSRSTQGGVTTINLSGGLGTATVGDFVFGMKDARVEGGNLRGYTMKIDLDVTSGDRLELFAVNSDIMKSYS